MKKEGITTQGICNWISVVFSTTVLVMFAAGKFKR